MTKFIEKLNEMTISEKYCITFCTQFCNLLKYCSKINYSAHFSYSGSLILFAH